jgi:glycosyltransferase involved in cell wall biosynthesis
MYQAADIYAFPSLMETFGMVQLEAMAAGAAVVSTDAPGCRDVIKHEQNGLQAHAGDVDSFVVQLGRLLEDQALREDLSAKGKAWVQDYSWANVANQYEAVFTALINDHRSDGSSQN